jgi:sugar/nucleoside kinase (ribokinase family)
MKDMTTAQNLISVVSSFSEDIIVNDRNEQLKRIRGAGPAYFITNALRDEAIAFDLLADDTTQVEILVTPEGEFGKVPTRSPIKPIDAKLADWTIISTILNEWDITSVTVWPSHLFVDLQGYVRNDDDFGKKQRWDDIALFADKIFCLKGTVEEMKYVPAKVREGQKRRLLIITNGSRGLDLYYKGGHTYIPCKRVTGQKNTIGAGDTFMAYFVASMYKGCAPVDAARHASGKTTCFLENKPSSKNS